MFNKNRMSQAILSAMVTTTFANQAIGQATDDGMIEEVYVTGIRASLERSLDIKRESAGIVDAISAEDIGRFPDANLAESLQRVPGVSIDRDAGEGNAVTVRGFGPSFNMVLTNGRQMPSSNDGRSFNFNDLASELVSGVTVEKTSSAVDPSGGIGSTINITTARPLDIGEFRLAGTLAGVSDIEEGSITPEISGLVSTTFADETMGVLFAASYQDREYEQERLAVDGWRVNQGIPEIENPEVNQTPNTFMAQNYNISVQPTERTRTNANLVFQYAPQDDLVVTADYLYSELETEGQSSQLGVWFNASNIENVRINENGTVVDMYEEGTFDNIQNWFETVSENQSFGINVDWDFTNSLNLLFDANFAKSEQNPGGEFNQYQGIVGYGNQQRFRIMEGSELPVITEIGWDPNRGREQAPLCGNPNWTEEGQQNCLDYAQAQGLDPEGVAEGPDQAGGIAESLLRAHRNDIQTENTEDTLNQYRLEGTWTEDNLTLQAGLMFTDQEKDNRIKYNAHEPRNVVEQFGGFYGFPPLSDEVTTGRTTIDSDFLDQFSGHEALPREWVSYNPDDYFADIWPTMGEGYTQIPTEWSPNSYEVSEETLATYVQLEFDTEVVDLPLNIRTGARLENTEVTSTGSEQILVELEFTDPTSMAPVYSDQGFTTVSETQDYDILLPHLLARLDFREDLIMRFYAGRSITRPDIGDLQATTTIGDTRPGGAMTANGGNPGLRPFSADNVDLSVEWYYDELSFVSGAFFLKYISDFIVDSIMEETINNVTDPSSQGGTIANPTPPSEADVALFSVSRPTNGPDARVEGIELAAQHEFWDTGFGLGANYTYVTTNRELDPADVDQRFAITGLSDSANLIGYYEQGPFQARLAFNWRDDFLQGFSQLQGGDAVIVEDYGQLDITLGYDITEDIIIQLEGINVTDEGYRSHARYPEQLYEAISTGPRYALSVRATF